MILIRGGELSLTTGVSWLEISPAMRKQSLNPIFFVILLLVTACAGQIPTTIVSPTNIEHPVQTPTPVVSQVDIDKAEQAIYASFFKCSCI